MNGSEFDQIRRLDVGPPWGPTPPAPPPGRRVPLVNLVLFVLTFVTTSMAGAFQVGADPIADPAALVAGFPFSMTLMGILLVHELGHYTLSRIHGVRATLPYFIPGPPVLIGTFGAFIRMKSPPPSRRALFDVGAAGPWAGFLLAVPAVYVGLCWSEVRPLGLHAEGLVLGDSILFSALTRLALGTTPDQVTILLHPVALAGWFGLFVTFLNLLPVGQLDGGHVTYAMFGRWHRVVARVFVVVIVGLGWHGWNGWFMWVVLLMLIGVDHPPTLDASTPLDPRRRLAAWLTVLMFGLTFIPEPLAIVPPSPVFEGERTLVRATPPPAKVGRDDSRLSHPCVSTDGLPTSCPVSLDLQVRPPRESGDPFQQKLGFRLRGNDGTCATQRPFRQGVQL